jgi:hypothetical protein
MDLGNTGRNIAAQNALDKKNQLQHTMDNANQAGSAYNSWQQLNTVDPNSTVQMPMTPIEAQTGIYRPNFETMRDRTTGQLRDIYKQNPFAGEAGQRLRTEGLSTGPSAWSQMAMQQQHLAEQTGRDQAMQQGQQAGSQAMADLARSGGLSSGARARIAMQSARQGLMGQQGVSRQGIEQRAGINTQDQQRRQALLGQVADAESKSQAANVGLQATDIQNKGIFDLARYKEQMGAYGAQQSANAQRDAASGGKK